MVEDNVTDLLESLDSCNKFEIIESNIVYNKFEDAYYEFENSKSLENFLMLEGCDLIPKKSKLNIISNSACLPDMPGYPNCQSNPIVRTYSKYVSHYNTGYISNNIYLLGNDGWVFGGKHGASMEYTKQTSLTFDVNGMSASVSVGKSSQFPVPKNKRGNIKYKARFRV